MRERRRDKITYFLQTTTTPTFLHLQRFALPKWAHAAYRVIVPLHDYALMPLVQLTRRRLNRQGGG
jgi:hypothetical protein